ncbi:MAG: 50S ribosomal protein L5 [Candidatus Anstonellales archaeon]
MGKITDVKIDKVVLNIGVGQPGERLDNAKKLLEIITGKKAIYTKAKERNPTFKIRPGLEIGVKVTLRGKDAEEILRRAFGALKNTIRKSMFDKTGNLSIGIKEYIDFPGVKYMPEIGVMGFDVVVRLIKPGYRVARRKRKPGRIGKRQRVTIEEAIDFISKKFDVKVIP